MHHFCTLFDSGYLTRGLSLYQSLADTNEDFTLYILAFDDDAYDILSNMKLAHVVLISLSEFEDERLLKIKASRTRQEYSWTCGCFSIKYVLEHFKCPEVTYLDSDIYFFAKPSLLLEEFYNSGKDVLITEHRYTPRYDQTATSGKYCVQFMTFKNNHNGLNVLNWWCDRCEEWCFARYENGKFGDQKYLDDWETRFDCVHVLKHLGGGVAPWNIQQYKVTQGPCVDDIPVVFFHFHGLRWLRFHEFDLSTYQLSDEAINLLYFPYLSSLQEQHRKVKELVGNAFAERYYKYPTGIINLLRRLRDTYRRKKEGAYNVISR